MILVIGYGNLMRSDDGIGISIVNRIAEENIPGVVTMTMHQLHVELLEEAIRYDKVIFVDARAEGEDVTLHKVQAQTSQMVSTHHLSPELFFELAKTIYAKTLDLYVCSVKGEHFEMGNIFSPQASLRAQKATDMITALIGDVSYA